MRCARQNNSRVETLDLEENSLGGEGTGHIADMLRENNTITGLVRRLMMPRSHRRRHETVEFRRVAVVSEN